MTIRMHSTTHLEINDNTRYQPTCTSVLENEGYSSYALLDAWKECGDSNKWKAWVVAKFVCLGFLYYGFNACRAKYKNFRARNFTNLMEGYVSALAKSSQAFHKYNLSVWDNEGGALGGALKPSAKALASWEKASAAAQAAGESLAARFIEVALDPRAQETALKLYAAASTLITRELAKKNIDPSIAHDYFTFRLQESPAINLRIFNIA